MKIAIADGKKTYRFYVPLWRPLIKWIVKLAVRVPAEKAAGQVCDERPVKEIDDRQVRGEIGGEETREDDEERRRVKVSFTAAEKQALLETVDEAVRALKKFRRRYGKFVLIEVQDEEGGVFIGW